MWDGSRWLSECLWAQNLGPEHPRDLLCVRVDAALTSDLLANTVDNRIAHQNGGKRLGASGGLRPPKIVHEMMLHSLLAQVEELISPGRHEAAGVHMTIDEARLFAQALLQVVAEIEASA